MSKLTVIIMAAGIGVRMGDLTKNMPKPLLKINNKPILEYDINFLKKVEVDEIIIVGGYLFEQLQKEIKKIDKNIKVIKNNDYKKGNIFSLKYGLDNILDGAFLLYHADHIYNDDIAEKIKKQLKNDILIFTDNDRNLTNDDMKVKIDENENLKKVAKTLNDFELGYVGITYCPEKYLDFYKEITGKIIKKVGENTVSENVMQYIVDKTDVDIKIGDISGSVWYEVDNLKDYNYAKDKLK